MKKLIDRIQNLEGKCRDVLSGRDFRTESERFQTYRDTEPLDREMQIFQELHRHTLDDLKDLFRALKYEVSPELAKSAPDAAREILDCVKELTSLCEQASGFEWDELETILKNAYETLLQASVLPHKHYVVELKKIKLMLGMRLEEKYSLFRLPYFGNNSS